MNSYSIFGVLLTPAADLRGAEDGRLSGRLHKWDILCCLGIRSGENNEDRWFGAHDTQSELRIPSVANSCTYISIDGFAISFGEGRHLAQRDILLIR